MLPSAPLSVLALSALAAALPQISVPVDKISIPVDKISVPVDKIAVPLHKREHAVHEKRHAEPKHWVKRSKVAGHVNLPVRIGLQQRYVDHFIAMKYLLTSSQQPRHWRRSADGSVVSRLP